MTENVRKQTPLKVIYFSIAVLTMGLQQMYLGIQKKLSVEFLNFNRKEQELSLTKIKHSFLPNLYTFGLVLVSPESICLTFSSGVWSKSHTLKSPREMHSSWSSSNGTFLIGGKRGIQIFTSVELGRYVENCVVIKWFSNVSLVTDNEDSEYSSIQLLNET